MHLEDLEFLAEAVGCGGGDFGVAGEAEPPDAVGMLDPHESRRLRGVCSGRRMACAGEQASQREDRRDWGESPDR